ncbi:MAG TPA: dihydroorotase [Acidimicrobiales bacterium]|nr:dihydroorotase [Acidimicrobiales bacterium]
MAERSGPAPVVIKGGDVVDRDGRRRADVLVEDGRIVAVEADLDAPGRSRVLDAGGCVVAPALVDLHTHLREPGREDAETIETGARAAARGGYGLVVAMPNTDPAIDAVEVAAWVRAAASSATCEVEPAAAITVGRRGEELAPMDELARHPDSRVRLFTDDGSGVQDDLLMRRAMEYATGVASTVPVVLAQHCEIDRLAAGGCMHEGEWSARLGVPGIPAEAEELMVVRDLALARLTGARIHFQHLSTAGSVELVRVAKGAGLPITAEATTHHFTLTHAELADYDPVFKVNPPLRTDGDVAAIKAGLGDGTIDAIATDHAPHTQDAKELPLDQAPPGMLGLETALAVALTELDLPIERVLALMSWQPAAIAGRPGWGRVAADGGPASLCVIDAGARWTVDPADLASKSRNTPYAGRALVGRVRHTIVAGEAVVIDGDAQR